MLGTIVNVIAVVAGTAIGCLLKHAIPEKIQKIIMQAIGLGVVSIGLASAIQTENFVLFVISLALGASIGNAIGIEKGLENIGDKLQKRFSGSGNTVADVITSYSIHYTKLYESTIKLLIYKFIHDYKIQ